MEGYVYYFSTAGEDAGKGRQISGTNWPGAVRKFFSKRKVSHRISTHMHMKLHKHRHTPHTYTQNAYFFGDWKKVQVIIVSTQDTTV